MTSWSECDLKMNDNRLCNDKNHKRCAAIMEAETRRDKIKYSKKCIARLENPCHERRREECRITLCDKDLCNFSLTPTATLIASSFKCKKCVSEISFEDCDYHSVVVFCGAGYRKCYKQTFTYQNGITEYRKGCTVPLACGDSQDKLPHKDDRDIQCCGQHICNAGVRVKNGPSMFIAGSLLLGSVMLVVFH